MAFLEGEPAKREKGEISPAKTPSLPRQII
jgi:hypothetical protein